MKKFLTFFALLCALLGFSVPISAADSYNDPGALYFFNGSSHPMTKVGYDYTYTVDATSDDIYGVFTNQNTKSWETAKNSNNCYIPNGAKNGQDNGKDQNFEATSLNGTWLYTWDIAWANNSIHFPKGKVYEAKVTYDSANRRFKATVTSYYYPTLYFRGEQTGSDWPAVDDYKFTRSGNVYTLTIPGGIGTGAWKIADSNWTVGSCWGAPTGQSHTLSNGGAYPLTEKTTTAENDPGDLKCPTNGKAATVTFTYNASGTSTVKVDWSEGPDVPTLSDANGNKVTITVPTGCDVYYSTTGGTPSTSTWTKYAGEITILEGSTTIYAASYKDGQWSATVQKTYTYTVGNPPYIYIERASHPFTWTGSDWVYTVDATSGKKLFRVQNSNNSTALGYNVSNVAINPNGKASDGVTYTATYDQEWAVPESAFGLEIPTEVYRTYSGKIALSNGKYQIKLNSDWSKITFSSYTPHIIRASAKDNYVTVKALSGYDLHYTIGGVEQTVATADVRLDIPAGGLTVTAWYTETGESAAIGGIAKGTFAYYEAPQKWPIKKWTLSDNDYFPVGTYKYFYMSRFQNDDRVSPEWELLDEGNGTYALRNFMVIPAGEFRIRRIYKKGDNSFDYNDFGLGSTSRLRLKDKFGVSGDNVALEKKLYNSSSLSLSKDQSRGYAWDMGYTMASVVVTHSTGDNLSVTAIADFTQPSTFNGAPLPGMPVVTLTSSKLMIPTIEGQSVSVATKLDTSHPEYDTAFTNAWIQYDGDSNMLVYGDGIGDGTAVYYSASDHKPQAGQVMNSTILPPRNPVVFKLVDFEGNETRITSDKIILKYNEERSKNTRQLKTPDGTLTKSNARFAVYELRDMEMAGLYKIYSGYGAHMYGSKKDGVKNGLSLFSNWGVGHQPSEEPYAGSKIESGQAYPLNGGGPKTDSNGYSWRNANNDTNGCYGNEDNWAGRYFEFSKRTYVSKLNFFYALERDTEGNDGKGNWSKLDGNNWNLAHDYYNSHHAQRTNDGKDEYYTSKDDTNSPHWNEPNYTNDGVNFSWFNMTYDGSIGRVILSKVGANTGRVLYSINNFVPHPGIDALHAYNVHLIKIDPKTGNPITGEGAYDKLVGSGDLNGAKKLEDQVATEADLTTGWYVARFIFHSDTHDEDTGAELPNQKNELYSTRIFVFGIEGAKIEALQRTSEDADGLKLYHPVIDVKPDATEAIAGLVDDSAEGSGVDKSMVYGYVEIASISTKAGVTKIVDTEGNALPESAEAAGAGKMYVTYDAANGKATVHYPKGFFSSAAPDMDFAVMNAAIGRYTDFKLTITADNAVKPATDEVSALVSMPGAKLYGQIVAEKREGSVKFNALRLADSVDPRLLSGVISYVDAKGQPCGVAEVDDTRILAHVLYGEYDPTDESGYIELTVGAKTESVPTDMKELVGGVKRYAVGAIPYETDEADGVKIRKNQTVPFTVNLDYCVDGYDDAAVNGDCNELTYAAANLTAPRDGLTDLNKDNYNNRGNDGVATDVTAVTESYVEKYGGLFTNIEDAHVALQAVPKNEDLVGDNSFDKWYMDHGDKWEDATANESTNPRNVNPFSPADHRAVGNTKRDGTAAYATVNEVHPLLITGSSSIVSTANDFQDGTGSVNNAWWNTNARVKPEFHTADHINGDFVRDDNGKVTAWSTTSTINHPRQHREWWAGVNAGNDDKYKVFGGSSVLKVEDQDVDIRDPKHSYYDNSSHFTTEPGIRTAYHLGEIPLNANDVLALYGTSVDRRNEIATYLGTFDALKSVALPFHENMDQVISEAVTAEGFTGSTTVTIDGSPYTINISPSTPWILDDLWKIRQTLAFKPTVGVGETGVSPAEQIFKAANNHMVFKVNHVNHESWWVPGAYHQIIQHDIKTRPVWGAFKGVKDADGKTIDDYSSDATKEAFVMKHLRMKLDDYCPLAYDVRYTYPFLTSKDYIAGEAVTSTTYAQSRINKAPAKQTEIEVALNAVVESAVTPVAAPSKGRVPFFDATTVGADEYVPTVLNDVSDDIRGNGFSIVYNRVAGTVTVTAEGERELKDAAVYDISGSSMVLGATADRINDRTIVLDVCGIAQGAYIVSTNLGGAKFMK